jgi:enterobactin synthetase component D
MLNRISLKIKNEKVQVMYSSMEYSFDELNEYHELLIPSVEMRSDKGKREFLLGRICAQWNLAELKLIDRDTSGRPVWSDDTIGSISHSRDFAIAAITNAESIKSIGIDIERVVDRKRVDVIKKMTLTREELKYLDSFSLDEQPQIATVIFGAKETLYKLINPLCNCYINFHEGIFESYDKESGKYTIRLESEKRELTSFQGLYEGQVILLENNIITLSLLVD